MENGINICMSVLLLSIVEGFLNMECRERYVLRDILMEDLDIEMLEVFEDFFEEICLCFLLLVEEIF